MTNRNLWVISDTHFNHSRILEFHDEHGRFTRPGFSSVEEMNEHIIECWNSVVKPNDKVYHLGDVFFGRTSDYFSIWQRLNGKKRLVPGNHDRIPFLVKNDFFEKVEFWRNFHEFGLLLTHTPVHDSIFEEARFEGKDTINVHGHIHRLSPPSSRHVCVCVEHTDYTPVNLEELRIR